MAPLGPVARRLQRAGTLGAIPFTLAKYSMPSKRLPVARLRLRRAGLLRGARVSRVRADEINAGANSGTVTQDSVMR